MSANWRVLLVDTKPGNVNHYLVLGVEQALRNDARVASVHFAGYADALHTAIEHDCNLFFAFDGEDLDRGLCRRLASICGTSVLWLTDDPYQRDQVNVKNAGLFDVVFTNDSASVPFYDGRAVHLPFAANPKLNFFAIPERDENHYLYDVLFIGTAWPNRVRFLQQLLKSLKGLKFKLALPGNEHLPVPDLDLAPSSYLWRLPNTEMCRLANRSRVVLTLHRDFGLAEATAAATPGPRLFEVALAGGFQVVDLSLPETSGYFDVGREIAGFSSVDECGRQIAHFVADPERRLQMVRAAQTRCMAEHLYEHRIRVILDGVTRARSNSSTAPAAAPRAATVAKKSRILFVAHNSVNVPPFGGVEVYVDLLARHLGPEFEPFTYYPVSSQGPGAGVVCQNMLTGETVQHDFASPYSATNVTDGERESYFARLLHKRRIDLVHFHHLINHPWSLPLIARTLGVPAVMSVVDHYAICDSYTLLNHAGRYCQIPERPAVTCDLCLGKSRRAAAGSQASRRAFIGSVLDNLDLLVSLSEGTRDILFSQFPLLAKRGNMLVEGYPLDDRKPLARLRVRGAKLKIAIVGNFVPHKGAEVICAVVDAMRHDPIEFHVHGLVLPPYHDVLRQMAHPNLVLHGAYKPESLRDALRDADVGLFLSIWPETYVLTLSEAWRAGVVPIVADLGALGERVHHGIDGLKVPVNEPGSVVHALRGLMADRDELERLRANIRPELYCQLGNHVRVLTAEYEALLRKFRVNTRDDEFFAEAPAPRPASAENVFRLEPAWFHAVPETTAPVPPTVIPVRPFVVTKVFRFWRSEGSAASVRRTIRNLVDLRRRVARIPRKVLGHVHRHGVGATVRRCMTRLLARVR